MRRTLATLLLLVLPLGACHKWTAPEVRPDVGSDRAPTYHRVRLTTPDGATRVLYDATIRSDSVVGRASPPVPGTKVRRVALSRAEITRVEVQRPNALGTAGTVVALGAVLFFGFVAVCAATECIDSGFGQ